MSGFGFIEPLFLWGLLFLGAVLLIHLLKRPRTVKLDFSTLRFFSASAVTANRSRRLRRLLLLLVRLLIVIVIVLIFARPYNRKDPLFPLNDPSMKLLVMIDQTQSMGYVEKGVPIYRRAIQCIDSMVTLRGGSTGISVFNVEAAGFLPYERFVQSEFRLRYTDDLPAFADACERAVEKDGHEERSVVMVLSDFQKPAAEALCVLSGSRLPPVVAVPLTPEQPWNLALQGATATAGTAAGVKVNVAAYGERGGAARVRVAAGTIRSSFLPCTLSAGDDTAFSVPLSGAPSQEWGTVELQSDDPLSFDNSGNFSVEHRGGYSVLVIGDVTVNFPVAAALKAADSVYWSEVTRSAPEEVTYEKCVSADLIIVNGCSEPVPALSALRSTRGNARQAFIVTAGTDTLVDHVWKQFVPTSVAGGKTVHSDVPLTVKLPDTVSGLWQGFPALFCPEVNVYTYHTGLQGIPVLNLSNGIPMATGGEDAFGRQWVVCATPLGITEGNNLCETGFYVPFIDRLARYACAGLSRRDELWFAGRKIRNPWYGSSSPVQLFAAGSANPLMRLQQQQQFLIEVPGVYKVVPPGARPYFKTVLPDTLESRCSYSIPESGDTTCGKWVTVSPQELLSYLKEHNRTVWWLLPWVVLAVLLAAEVLLRERGGVE
ncbi:MAG: BatA domain-containing protein [Chitinispirillaceae bacterium]|nr:BatA domain-containing protein [Chitinispirillaceae bacterium]